MTTIAFKNGVLAADKMAASGDIPFKATKLFRTKTHAIAFAGEFAEGIAFVKWFPVRDGKCPLKKTDALVMDLETGVCSWWEGESEALIEDSMAAIGSGAGVALGAMSFGASAREAIECSSAWDTNTGLGCNYAKSKKARRRAKAR
jgi:hypothetical protein